MLNLALRELLNVRGFSILEKHFPNFLTFHDCSMNPVGLLNRKYSHNYT